MKKKQEWIIIHCNPLDGKPIKEKQMSRKEEDFERLQAINDELLEALKILSDAPIYDKNGNLLGVSLGYIRQKPDYAVSLAKVRLLAREAIAKAEGTE